MASTLCNKCTKNCCKRTILVQVIVKDVVTCFLRHSVESNPAEVLITESNPAKVIE